MQERPSDVWAGKAFFVKKPCSDDAGHDTRVVTTLGVASYEDWFDEVSALSADINWSVIRHVPLLRFRHEHFAAPAPGSASRGRHGRIS